jgi:hypothetical protein
MLTPDQIHPCTPPRNQPTLSLPWSQSASIKTCTHNVLPSTSTFVVLLVSHKTNESLKSMLKAPSSHFIQNTSNVWSNSNIQILDSTASLSHDLSKRLKK